MSTEEMASNAGEVTKALHDLRGSIHFVIKQLRPSHVPENRKKNCTLMIPVRFVKEHGDKLHEIVTLRSRLCTEPWTVQLTVQCCKSPGPRPPEIKFGKGWKAFATRNELTVGDSVIFELTGVSQFEVHIVRKTAASASSASRAPENRSSIDSELSQKNGNNGAGCSNHQQQYSVPEKSEGSVDDLSNWIAKKRKVGDNQVEDSAASQTPLPSFTQRLVEYNNHDSAGNTCGARFEVPGRFLEMHGIELRHHVKLQGVREDSPVQTVTCSSNVLKDGEDSTKPALWLGWGDFVRENGLRAGQELAFTLTSESFFVVRDVNSKIVI